MTAAEMRDQLPPNVVLELDPPEVCARYPFARGGKLTARIDGPCKVPTFFWRAMGGASAARFSPSRCQSASARLTAPSRPQATRWRYSDQTHAELGLSTRR